MADQLTTSNKRPHSETPPPSPSKARRVDDITSVPVNPPNNTNYIDSLTTTDLIAKPRIPTKPLSEMTREEIMQLHDPVRCAEVERTSKELQQEIEKELDELSKLSSVELEQWRIDFRKKHGENG